jgi:hypothetical protein
VGISSVDSVEVARRLAAYAESGNNQRAAAEALGIARETLQRTLRHAGIIGGIAASPERDGGGPYVVKGVSTYFDSDGNQRGQWVKTRVDDELRAKMQLAAAEAMAADLPRLEPVPFTGSSIAALCNLYTITDYHLNALCWHKEGGANWNLKISEATGEAAFVSMLEQSPRARVGIVNVQGDFMHTDGLTPVTPGHGHVLDADGRFSKAATVAVRLIRQMVALALERHEQVHLLICEGNHDESSSVWLRVMFAALYELEPRVTVNDSELPYYVYQHGKIMLAFHHGHKVKNEALPMLFAAQFSRMWGDTVKRYAHCGHRHHADEKEYSGMLVTQHPTLAARDAYAARGGWISERAAQSITYHEEYGQVARTIVCPEMLQAA